MKKVVALAAVLVLALAGPAAAGDGYADEDTVVADKATYVPGGPITVSAQVFLPGTPVTFTMYSEPVVLGTATADDAGVATLTATLPDGVELGSHRVEAAGTGLDGQPLVVNTTITLGSTAQAAEAGDAALPRTGSDATVPLGQLAIGAIAAGGVLVLVAGKRRQAKATSESVGV